MIYFYCYKESGHTKYQCRLLKEKSTRDEHVSVTIPDDEQLRHQFEQFQIFQQQQNIQAQSFSFFASLKHVKLYLVLHRLFFILEL